MKVRIVGLGTFQENETCIITGEKATGYIQIPGCYDEYPCKLNILGPGEIGTDVEVPQQYHDKIKQIQLEHTITNEHLNKNQGLDENYNPSKDEDLTYYTPNFDDDDHMGDF